MFGRSVRRVVASSRCPQRRKFGGGGGGHADPELEAAKAAALKLRNARGMKRDGVAWNDPAADAPFLKPRPPGLAREDWEFSWYLLMGGSFVLLGLGEFYRPDKGPENWARDEAEERMRMEAAGETPERLHNYAPGDKDRTVKYIDSFTSAPTFQEAEE
jgi:hypothetical protein